MKPEESRPLLLIVDDSYEEIRFLEGILNGRYRVDIVTSGESALHHLANGLCPQLILLDWDMPGFGGQVTCQKFKEDPRIRAIPVVMLVGQGRVQDEEEAFDVGAVDVISKPIGPTILRARIATHVALNNQQLSLEQMVVKRTQQYIESQKEIINRLARAAEFRDNETGLHVLRVSAYAYSLAGAVGLGAIEAENIAMSAPLHDIGKIGIPDNILQKKGKLDEIEWKRMRQHPQIGADIIGLHDSDLLLVAYRIALTHHEKWNGKGYPKGLKGEEIPIEGRIVAIADVFDALTTERPYKRAWTIQEALDQLVLESGESFDPKLVTHFLNIEPIVRAIHSTYVDDSDTGFMQSVCSSAH